MNSTLTTLMLAWMLLHNDYSPAVIAVYGDEQVCKTVATTLNTIGGRGGRWLWVCVPYDPATDWIVIK